jgi:hypothetical protein
MLWGHVQRRPHQRADTGHGRVSSAITERTVLQDLGDAKVEDLDERLPVFARRAEEVFWLQIPMNDPNGVRFGNGFTGLQDEVNGLSNFEPPFLPEPSSEIAPFQVLDHLVGDPIAQHRHVEDASHMLALDVCRGPRLAHEASDGIRVLQYLRLREFDSDSRIQVNVLGCPNHAHATATEPSLDAISPIENVPFVHANCWFDQFRRHSVAD